VVGPAQLRGTPVIVTAAMCSSPPVFCAVLCAVFFAVFRPLRSTERSHHGGVTVIPCPTNARSDRCTNGRSGSSGNANRCLPRTHDRGTVARMTDLTPRQRQSLESVDPEVRRRGYPPSVREIGEAVGLSSSSTVHAHLAALQDKGYLTRDPTKPRAIEVRFDIESGAAVERRPVRHVPLVGDVAAGTGVLAAENVEETLPLPEDFTGDGQLFMVRVRGDSMIDPGIFDGHH